MLKPPAHPLSELTALSPLDGRYRSTTQPLAEYFSEYTLIKTRLAVEAQYLIFLSEKGVIRNFSEDEKERLQNIATNLTIEDAAKVKKQEAKTQHDVKAMEIVFRSFLKETSLADVIEIVHFGLTSEDVNNLAYRLMLKRGTEQVCIPAVQEIISSLLSCAKAYRSLPMLGRTHGQPAVPTTLGKEFSIFALRLDKELRILKRQRLTGKMGGAIGNFSALYFAYPNTNWLEFSKKFVSSLGLIPNLLTTQINTYEDIIAYLQIYQRMNNILLDLDQDMWRYISDNWFIQETKKEEVGSSTMPQKVNPIRFENSEGNLGLANSLIEFMVRKLPISRLQRDLSDSTVIRNLGTILGYSLIAYESTYGGLRRIKPNIEQITHDLNKDWSILAEAVQTLLRKEGIDDPYSLIKSLTRGKHIGEKDWQKWISELPINEKIKQQLKNLTPEGYIGLALQLVDENLEEMQTK